MLEEALVPALELAYELMLEEALVLALELA
jgi:hypothetical protein